MRRNLIDRGYLLKQRRGTILKENPKLELALQDFPHEGDSKMLIQRKQEGQNWRTLSRNSKGDKF